MSKDLPLKLKKQSERCPICGKSKDNNFIPFYSKRCADYDLGKWLLGDYKISVNEDKDMDDRFLDEGY